MEPDALRNMLCCSDGPKTNATKAEYVKFYDDKNLYTGVHKRKSDNPEDHLPTTPDMINNQISRRSTKSFH